MLSLGVAQGYDVYGRWPIIKIGRCRKTSDLAFDQTGLGQRPFSKCYLSQIDTEVSDVYALFTSAPEPDKFFNGQSIVNGLLAFPVGFVDKPLIVVDLVEGGGKLC